uniref:Uncharacterized protein n=1 Tax=Manihot esculenta TaxID=3983 RepID=A0A2C9VYD2_MANES
MQAWYQLQEFFRKKTKPCHRSGTNHHETNRKKQLKPSTVKHNLRERPKTQKINNKSYI